jgi:hypothetical protein
MKLRKFFGELTEVEKEYVLGHYSFTSVKDMAAAQPGGRKIPMKRVYEFLDERGLESYDRTKTPLHWKAKKDKVPEGYFNVHACGDTWLI